MSTKDKLLDYINRVERLDNEKRALGEDISEVLKEAGGEGFDKKTIRKIVRLRRKSAAERQQEQALLETYLTEIGEVI